MNSSEWIRCSHRSGQLWMDVILLSEWTVLDGSDLLIRVDGSDAHVWMDLTRIRSPHRSGQLWMDLNLSSEWTALDGCDVLIGVGLDGSDSFVGVDSSGWI